MAGFVVVIPSQQDSILAPGLFRTAIDSASQVWSTPQINDATEPWASAAVFARHNGSGSAIVSDGPSGSWLLAIGPWFHGDGYASGSEPRLLQAYLRTGGLALARALEGFFVSPSVMAVPKRCWSLPTSSAVAIVLCVF